ncbi:MAG TPA: ATP-dependent Clp protease adapter ClpS [Candidatus Dormibacteraeota bacterium]|nr:ATP-dependent Clp protease adapter ClpS [Candidatus Dormibacteraeota bacterium]
MSTVQEGVSAQTGSRVDGETKEHRDRPWRVVVWNDPVTLMSYVVFVLRRIFGYDQETATRLMLQVHTEGKAVVATELRERAEVTVAQLHAHGLQATLARD